MSDYTPTTEEVRDTYEGVYACGCCAMPDEESLAQFDRWLAEHGRQVAEKAWDEGALAQEYWITNPNYEVEENPYRKAVQS